MGFAQNGDFCQEPRLRHFRTGNPEQISHFFVRGHSRSRFVSVRPQHNAHDKKKIIMIKLAKEIIENHERKVCIVVDLAREASGCSPSSLTCSAHN